MNAVPFDTLKLARKLEASGMTGPMAAGTAEALVEAMGGSEVATKADIAGVKAEIGDLRTELKADIGDLRTELKADIAGLGSQLRLEMEVLRRDLVIKCGSMLVVAVGVLIAVSRYLPPHP
jgi:hypothetical protein